MGSPGRYLTLSKRPPQYLSVRTTLAGTVAGMEGDDNGPLAGVSIGLDGHGPSLCAGDAQGHRRA